ncbi:hypothetical protein [Mycobacterium asiaticum]|uniref:hypothetical protein n=1 Tax=Mycobacterium asiaticum TaxID=1790 RepID=UPI000AEC1893|nr:hypothetical protein [Mycobacterium asiaticum]
MDSLPSRDDDLEEVVDQMQKNVTDERREENVPGNATEREQAPVRDPEPQQEPPD